MNPDHDQAFVAVLLRPSFEIGQLPDAVDARVRPEIDDHDFTSQTFRCQWGRIQPFDGTGHGR